MRKITIPGLVALGLALPGWADDLAAIQRVLEGRYTLTTTTADKTDILTAGSVLTLKKNGLLTVDVTGKTLSGNTYKSGRITQNVFGKTTKFFKSLPYASDVGSAERTFVTGEKVWVTAIEVKENGVVFSLLSDSYKDVRYAGTLLFPFEKYKTPTTGEALAEIAEVFESQAPQGGSSASAPPTGEAAPPPIMPPPPPPAEAKTIALGQTPETVVANFGQPDKIIKLAAKQIYVYKDMKVTFVNGKVTDIQ